MRIPVYDIAAAVAAGLPPPWAGMKLLIDECLSEELAKLARDRWRPGSSHVGWIGKAGAKD